MKNKSYANLFFNNNSRINNLKTNTNIGAIRSFSGTAKSNKNIILDILDDETSPTKNNSIEKAESYDLYSIGIIACAVVGSALFALGLIKELIKTRESWMLIFLLPAFAIGAVLGGVIGLAWPISVPIFIYNFLQDDCCR